ncbi:MAG: hypothetical protein KKF46_00630 [Nanoarchaeota archaeon]|nr:hypothetical protein [Nanoarchaeota archaeon]MBU1320840.1 hypothetical protein [Nanoarchaeota archaeon]MBU1598063.1 hypothetical protein [Nanoarchaeota archaeon]MBU2441486.1 hypothetical protein [Nanoarchaeota archaeon]
MANNVPFSSGFMLTSMLGFLISVLFVMKYSETWGFTFALVFVIMFIASIVTMGQIDADDRYGVKALAVHHKDHYKKKKK